MQKRPSTLAMRALLLGVIGALSAGIGGAEAQAPFPSKAITLVVPFGAGSGTDTITRLIGQQLSLAVGQPVIVENKAGGNGIIGASQVARSAPDGYTLLVATNTTHSANPAGMMKDVPYDAVKDFTPITRVGNYIFVVAVNADLPVKTLPELIAKAKAEPGTLSFATGNGTGIVAGETLKAWAGVDILHVPYKSTPPAMQDVIAGRVSMIVIDLTAGMTHLKSGRMRALAVTTRERTALLPELPSLHEAGVTNYNVTSWCGLFAPAGTPKDVVARLNAELRKIIDSPEIKGRLAAAGFEAFSSSPEDLAGFVQEQLVLYKRLIKDAKIVAE